MGSLRAILAVILVCCVVWSAEAASSVSPAVLAPSKILIKPDSPQDEYLDEIAFWGLQLNAVVVDMYVFTGWAIDEKKKMAKASKEAIKHLDFLKDQVNKISTPNELLPLRDIFLKNADDLKELFRGMDKKDIKKVSKDFADIWDKYTNDCEAFSKTLDFSERYSGLKDVSEPEPIFEEKDQGVAYQQGMVMMKKKKFGHSYRILAALKKQITSSSVEYDYVLLAMSDLIGKSNNTTDEDGVLKDFSQDEIRQNAQEIFAKEYSPLFLEFFIRWRTITQEMDHGMSNWSSIPNWEYNLKRRMLIDKVKAHVSKNPNDSWAHLQLQRLIDLDNIQRGGPYGNDNLNYIGGLYMDLEDMPAEADAQGKGM